MTTQALALPELAANQNQPDVTHNDALRIIDAALAGEVVIEVEEDDDILIGISGIPAEWQYASIVISDSGSPAVLTGPQAVIWPAVPRRGFFTLRNNTAENLTIKRVGQTGVLVVAGGEATVRDTGTDIVAPAQATAVTSDDVANESAVPGATVSLALEALLAAIAAIPGDIYTRGAAWNNSDEALVAGDANVVYVQIPASGNITRWTLLTTGGVGDCQVDVWRDNYANFPPDAADSITAAAPPAITAGIKGTSSTLTGWATSVTVGDVLAFKLDGSTNFTHVSIQLEITP